MAWTVKALKIRSARPDKAADVQFLAKTIKASGIPEKVTRDKSGANKAAMDEIHCRGETPVIIQQVKYLNNIVQQDHRAVKGVTKPRLNFQSFRSTRNVLAGIELMPMIRKSHLLLQGCIKAVFC